MRKKIFLNFVSLAILSSILTAVLISVIFYNFYLDSEWKSLKNTAYTISSTIEYAKYDDFQYLINIKKKNPNIRITIINSQGKVLFDTDIKQSQMENHLERPEVREAIRNGTGESTRYSTTLGQDTHYFSVLLSDGSILRISQDYDNIFTAMGSILPGIIIIALLVIFLSFFMSSLLSKKILKPIKMATENIDKIISGVNLSEFEIYDELLPFTQAVNRQSLEIKKYVNELKEKADTIETITENMSEGFILIEENKKIVSLNNSAIKLLDAKDDKNYYKESFIVLSRNIEINNTLDKVLETGESKEILVYLSNRYLNVYINPVVNDEKIIGAMLLIVNNTDKYMAEKMRREFSANVSHELKTPLTSINGYAEIIESGLTSKEDTVKFAGIIRKEGNRLLELIDSVIKLSKLDEGFVKKEFVFVDLYEMANNIFRSFEVAAKEKNINIIVQGYHNKIQADKNMMEELLYNLIDNAIKYNKVDGTVNVKIQDEINSTILTISDTGIGIPKEAQERVFERFYMLDKSRGNKSTGLGLSIVKHIVEYHNGSISLKSEVGYGTEIKIKLPKIQLENI
ncbi:MAG: histidine kinase [Sporanaerobacter sp.]|uniref:sensor histidine kinase n=1 Tax=Sporanaerobacter sp. TaxID=2010183 RepID=UPI003A0FD56C